MRDERYDWIALKVVKGIGTVLYKRLLEEFEHPAEVFSGSRNGPSNIEGMSKIEIEEILHFEREEGSLHQLDLMNTFLVSLIHYFHLQYPRQLKKHRDLFRIFLSWKSSENRMPG
jgi:predicted Rossmann fold nucleotide-binding protein DprA/Smf involved in DNA uptake